MRKILKVLIPVIVATFVVVGIISAANTFPTSVNVWVDGDIIESDWANALEDKIGVDNSATSSSLDYLIKNTSSKLGKIASLGVTDGNFLVGDGTNWSVETGNTARTSLSLGTGDSPTFTGLTVTNASTTNLTISGITGTANNCLQVDTNGNVSGTAAACGGEWTDAGSFLYPSEINDAVQIGNSATISNIYLSVSATTTTGTIYHGSSSSSFTGNFLLFEKANGDDVLKIDFDGITIASTTLDETTGNEVAYELHYVVNKATSGNADGFTINMVDTASPGTFNRLFALEVNGTAVFQIQDDGDTDINFTATEANSHGLRLDINSGNFADVVGLLQNYDAGDLADGEEASLALFSLDRFSTTGGDVHGVNCGATTGSAKFQCIKVGPGVGAIFQASGGFGDMDECTDNGSDILSSCTSTASDVEIFSANGDMLVIGDAAQFTVIDFIFAIPASGAGIKPKFEFSTGSAGWAEFNPTDGTRGARDNGNVSFELDDIPTWATGTSSRYFIRITREQTSLTTAPTEDIIQISATNIFEWNANGDLLVRNVTSSILALTNDLAVVHGGTGTSVGSITGTGDLTYQAGSDAKDINLTATNAVTGNTAGGNFTFKSGIGTGTGAGGDLNISLGNGGASGVGGSLFVSPGSGTTDGTLTIFDPTSGNGITFDTSVPSDDRIYTFPDVAGTFLLTDGSQNATISILVVTGNTTLANATVTSLGVTGLTSAFIRADSSGNFLEGAADSTTVGQVLRVTGSNTYAFGALDLADGDAVTGTLPEGNIDWVVTANAVDFGGATSFEIPNGTSSTVNAVGEMALDTTNDHFQLVIATSTTEAVFARWPTKLFSVTVASTSIAYASGSSLIVPPDYMGFIIDFIGCQVIDGTSKAVQITDGSNDTNQVTCSTTTATTSLTTNNTFTSLEDVFIKFGTESGTTNYLTISAFGSYTRE